MKIIFSILFLFLTFSALSKNDETAVLKSIDRAIHRDFTEADSLLRVSRPMIAKFSDEGKLQYVIYDLVYQITSNQFKVGDFDEYLTKLNVSVSDSIILNNLHLLLLGDFAAVNYAQLEEVLESKNGTLTADRKALLESAIGFHYFENSDKHFKNALKYARTSQIPIIPSIVFHIISRKHKQIGNYREAVKYYQKALDFSRDHDYELCILQYSLAMALIQVEMDNLDKAKSFFESASSISIKLRNNWSLSRSLRGLGNVSLIENDLKPGINYFQRALIIYYKMSSDIGIAQTHKDLGKAYFLIGDYELSENNFDLSRTYYNKIKSNDNGEDDLYENYAQLKYQQGKYQEALEFINMAIKRRVKLGENQFQLHETYGIRSKIFAALGYGNKAYKDLLRSTNYKDSIYSTNLQQQIADLSELYESEQKSQQIFDQEQKLKEERNERLLREQQLENTQLRNRQIIIVFLFSILLLVAIFLIFYFKNKQRQLKRKQTEVELRQQLLRSQMNPHFVFNAMSVIQSYIYDNDTEKSSEFLVSLSRLMRLILENSAKESIKLVTELEILERYLFIQKERFESRFDFEIKTNSDVDAERTSIPPMILQPFVENATEHGELDKVINGKIRITYKIEDQLLIFVVEDNGIGREAARNKLSRARLNKHKSMAISITEKRIDLMRLKYGVQGFVIIEDLDKDKKSGTKVTVGIPFIN